MIIYNGDGMVGCNDYPAQPSRQVPTRVENIRFMLKLDARQVRRHRMALAVIKPHLRDMSMGEDDTLHFDYTVTCQYLGEVERNLDAMLEILEDDEVVLGGDLEEMIHGRSLIVDVLAKMDEIIAREASR